MWWGEALNRALKVGKSHHLIQGLGWKGCEAEAFFRTALAAVRFQEPEALAFLNLIGTTTDPKLCNLVPQDETRAQRCLHYSAEEIMSALKGGMLSKTETLANLLTALNVAARWCRKVSRDIGEDYNVGLRVVRLLIAESKVWAVNDSARMHLTQPLLTVLRNDRGYGIYALNGEGKEVRMIYDRTISNYSFLEEMFQKADIPMIYAGFSHRYNSLG
ncbi:hypothetical protein N431DRAFT_467130 [Stipitochalara longipes BDJ]|nr:hypothetical protein N431DRAFT_467130 [Stipitochalara longipes BDJ]